MSTSIGQIIADRTVDRIVCIDRFDPDVDKGVFQMTVSSEKNRNIIGRHPFEKTVRFDCFVFNKNFNLFINKFTIKN